MNRIIIFSCLILLSATACNDNKNDSINIAKEQNKEMAKQNNIEKDAEYAVKAASGGLMEVELGNLAIANGFSQAVKDFGRGMVEDHTMANSELKSLATSKNIILPEVPGKDHQEIINKLKSKTGEEFDKEYMTVMVEDHKEDIELFENEAKNGNDPELKMWANDKIPILSHHLQMAEDIKKGL